ncbi:lipopolysaccharide assembly protein LapB [Tropicimonas sp. IMCC34043]|uniref:tetratricopeptide repeat protein n=1 Tax=Tropicimonas sp. IMCC34043 TaxID=2248760 RepID=UPI000E221A9A|nr:hypothetical protein [Tropicimonas sp. IMCC34043]
MKRAVAAATMLALFGSASAGETVRVLSGEHDDFTRIVLIFQAPVTWSESRDRDGFAIRFDRSDISPDLSRIFDRIPRDRISEVSFNRSTATLRLESDCNCLITVFKAGKNTIAIDVKSNPDPSASDLRLPLDQPGTALPAIASPEPTIPTVPAQSLQKIQALQDSLVLQLGRAASQGLIEIDPVPGPPRSLEELAGLASPATRFDPDAWVHLRSHTVIDSALPGLSNAAVLAASPACPDPYYLDASNWAGSDDTSLSIAMARSGVVDALDRPDPAGIEALAKAYLRFGFGAEAEAVIREFPGAVAHPDILTAVAQIMDKGQADDATPLVRIADCDGPYALWAVLAQGDRAAAFDRDTDALQQWFFRLPPDLRGHLGPILARRLHASGDVNVARSVRDATARTLGAPTADLVVLDAQTGMTRTSPAIEQAELESILSTAGVETGPALVELLRRRTAAGTTTEDLVVLAESLAFEGGASDLSVDLLEQAVPGRAQIGDLKGALADFMALDQILPESPRTDRILSAIFLNGAKTEDDIGLLVATEWLVRNRRVEHLSQDAAAAASERLLALDLPDEADRLLAPFRDTDAVDIRQLRARAAMMKGDPAMTLSLLAGEADPESRELRAEALLRLGSYEKATELFESVDRLKPAARAAWLSADAEAIARLGSDGERGFMAWRENKNGTAAGTASAAIDLGGSPDNAGPRTGIDTDPGSSIETGTPVPLGGFDSQRPSLAAGRTLLARSSDLRIVIATLLSETGVSGD